MPNGVIQNNRIRNTSVTSSKRVPLSELTWQSPQCHTLHLNFLHARCTVLLFNNPHPQTGPFMTEMQKLTRFDVAGARDRVKHFFVFDLF